MDRDRSSPLLSPPRQLDFTPAQPGGGGSRERAATRCGAASLSGCEARLLSERKPSLSPPSLRLNGEETSLPSRSDVSPFTNVLVRVHRCYTMHSMHEGASLFELREDWENRF